jgi:ABC-type polysaccharide/polyol phosphate transport system ATPase subunit
MDIGGALNPELTGRENSLLYGALFQIPPAQMEEFIPKIVSFSELGGFFDVPIKTYSAGMTARLAFALSTELNPDILLIDEVLAVGDEQFQKKCYFRMRKLMERGSIVVLVSHNAQAIQSLCTRAVYLARGRVAADGDARAVVARYQRDAAS